MAKEEFSQAIRSEYKLREREIKIKGDIKYKVKKSVSDNLMPTTHIYEDTIASPRAGGKISMDMNAGILTLQSTSPSEYASSGYISRYQFTLQPGTYTLSITKNETGYAYNRALKFGLYEETSFAVGTLINENAQVTSSLNIGTNSSTFTLTEEKEVAFIGIDYGIPASTILTYNIMLNEGDEPLSWEEPSDIEIEVDETFSIGENGQCEILDFKVDETSDLYYENMPFSELSVDVDNTDGYFSDFEENSIVHLLNKDSYIEFYLNINETGWCKAWTMQFDSLTADTQKATLRFKPYCSSILNMGQIYDANKDFVNYPLWSFSTFSNYVYHNYNVVLEQDATTGGTFIINRQGKTQVKDLFLDYAGGLANYEAGQILTIKDNKKLRYKNIQGNGAQETLTNNEILEKPLITKEVLEGIVKNFKTVTGYGQAQYFQKDINSIIKNGTDVLVIYSGFDYDIYDFTDDNISDNYITVTGATLISKSATTSGGASGLGSHYLILEISGNVGDNYTISLNGYMPYAYHEIKETQQIYAKGKYETTDNFIKLDAYRFANTKYWERLVNNLEKKIKLRITALPYLQVGDMISLENEGNVIISEIHTTWNNGFIMEITAYKIKTNNMP